MAHALAPDFLQRHFDAAFLAGDALVLHAFVFAAQAFVILGRAKDTGAEQTVTFRLEGPVVDGFRLLYFAERPRADALGRGDRDSDVVKLLCAADLPKNFHQFVHIDFSLNTLWAINAIRRSGQGSVVP